MTTYTEKLWRFSLGNSSEGPIGAEMVVIAESENAAYGRADELLQEARWMNVGPGTGGVMVFDGRAWDSGSARPQEYCQVYFNNDLRKAFELKLSKDRLSVVEEGDARPEK